MGFTEQTLIASLRPPRFRRASTFVQAGALGWGQVPMNREFLLRLAERVREMIPLARSDIAKEQLRVWAEEFDAAAELEEAQQQVAALSN